MDRCGRLSSCNVSIIIFDYFLFKKSAPHYSSAADAATNFIIWHRVNIGPLRWMGCLSCGVYSSKKCPAARLRASISDKYEASE